MNTSVIEPARQTRLSPLSRSHVAYLDNVCLSVLSKHGIVPDPNERFTLEPIIGDICDYFEVAIDRNEVMRLKPLEMDRHTLDVITLECAVSFTKVFPHVHDNKNLDYLRKSVVRMIVRMGYENKQNLCASAKPSWQCYKEWVAVAEADEVSPHDIQQMRDSFRRTQPEFFEEA